MDIKAAGVRMMDIHRYENDHVVVVYKNDNGQFLQQRRVRKKREAGGHLWVGTKEDEKAVILTNEVFSTQKDALDWAKSFAVWS